MSSKLQAPSVLLLGGPGSGKTHSISTLLEGGLEVFVICTEPTGLDTLVDVCQKKKLDLSRLHFKAITPNRPSIAGLKETAGKVALMDFEGLAKLKPSGNRKEAQWIQLLSTLQNFVDEKDGKAYGDVTQFLTPKQALVIDSLSGISLMAMDIVTGDKPSAHQGEWGIAMSLIEKLLLTLSSSLNSMFILTAHLEREVNELTGGTTITASTLGRKLAPRLPRFFSEVVMTYRENDKFFWSTTATGVDLKARALPLLPRLEPSFVPIIQAYNSRLKFLAEGEKQLTLALT